MTTEPNTTTRASRTTRTRTRYRLLAIAIAVVAAVVVWIVATLAGSRLELTSPLVGTLQITLPLVLATAIPVAFAAWGVLALLERSPRNAHKIWTIIAVVILVVAVLSVFFLDATIGTKVALGIMHLAVGLPLTILLPRASHNA
jgi:Kef-type K+ transport system membrane component KefB